MHSSPYSLALVVLAVVTAFGCASQSLPRSEDQPKIESRTTSQGKGVPNGRSDSTEPFLRLQATATDTTYGHTPANPIKVGGTKLGPTREKMYLNALMGANGQPIEYERLGSCCHFSTPNGIHGGGLLDAFRITFQGQRKSSILYMNIYDEGDLLVPVGFSPRSR